MFDLTKKIDLPMSWQKRYRISRAALWEFFFAFVIVTTYQMLFPSAFFDYFFQDPKAQKNTIVFVRGEKNQNVDGGKIAKHEKLTLNANAGDGFSGVTINLNPQKDIRSTKTAQVSVRKSYFSFFYPQTDYVCFANGTYVKINNSFYLTSDGQMRELPADYFTKFGIDKAAAIEVKQMPKGCNLSVPLGNDEIANGTLFKIQDEYYQKIEGKIAKFISPAAFASKYREEMAINKDLKFLAGFEISDQPLGFADGSILAAGDSGYIASRNNIYPVSNGKNIPLMGLDFDDMIQATSADLAIYDKQKLFTLNSAHPDGTIFFDPNQKHYFMVWEEQLKKLDGQAVVQSYNHRKPVVVDEQSLQIKSSCTLQKSWLSLRALDCTANLETIENLPGNDYEFSFDFPQDVDLDTLNLEFDRKANFKNMRLTLSSLKKTFLSRYNPESIQ